jgi:hypothetical protein
LNHVFGAFRKNLRQILTVLAITVAAAFGPVSALARDAELLGNIAADARAECPAGSAMVGIAGKAGATIVGLVAQCVRIDADLRWQDVEPSPGALLGVDDPAIGIQTATCVPNSFVTAIGANAAVSPPNLSMLWIQCGNRAGPQQTAGQSILFPVDPGAASLGLGASRCTTGEIAVGIAGHAGEAIGALNLVCSPLSTFGAAAGQTSGLGAGSLQGGAQNASDTPPANSGGPGAVAANEEVGPGSGSQETGPGISGEAAGPGGGDNVSIGTEAAGGGGLDTGSLDPAAGLPTENIVQSANVRAKASIEGAVTDTLSAGTPVHYAERVGTWCHVYYDGKDGWISTTLIACGGKLTSTSKPATQKTKSKTTTGTASQSSTNPPPANGSIVLPGGITIHLGN